MPRQFSVQVSASDDEAEEPDVELFFEVRDGVPECRGLHVTATEHGPELRCADWIGISKDNLLELAVQSLIKHDVLSDGRTALLPLSDISDFGGNPRRGVQEVRRARAARKVKLTDDMLRRVADVYRAHPRRPTTAVAEHFDKSHRTAAYYVERARQKGFLGAAMKGKAGEQ